MFKILNLKNHNPILSISINSYLFLMDSPIIDKDFKSCSSSVNSIGTDYDTDFEFEFEIDSDTETNKFLKPVNTKYKSDSNSNSESDSESDSELNENLIYDMRKSNINSTLTEEKINFYLKNLTKYEKEEIISEFSFENIHYIGNIDNKNKKEIHYSTHCYDDLAFNYKNTDRYDIIQSNHINYRYQIGTQLGKGSYGNVVKCLDHKEQCNVAIKIYKNGIKYRQSNINEIHLLKLIKDNYTDDSEYVLLIKDYFIFRHHHFMVSNIYGVNLYENRNQIHYFTFKEKLKIISDLFNGLEYLKNGIEQYTIIHADLKPENILMKYSCTKPDVLIADFGLSKKINTGNLIKHNFVVQSRYYRAPEIYFQTSYNESIDIWSMGCIIYEIFMHEVLFSARKDNDLLIFIHQVIGIPTPEFIKKNVKILKYYRNNKPRYIQDFYYVVREPLSDPKINIETICEKYKPHYIYKYGMVDPEENKELISKQIEYIHTLIKKCLVYDYEKRIKPIDGIKFINKILEDYK